MSKRDARKEVLFVCIGNACRSLMAEAIARLDAPDAIDAFSAGLMPIGFVPELTNHTLMKNGYWVDGLESKGISSVVWERVDVVINMTGVPKKEVFGAHSKVVDWEIEDPFERGPEDYQRAFDKIRARVAELAKDFKREYAANRLAERQSRPRLHATSPILHAEQLRRLQLPNPTRPGAAAPFQRNVQQGFRKAATRASPGTLSEFAVLAVLTVIFTFALRSLATHRAAPSGATTAIRLGTAASNSPAKPRPTSLPTTPGTTDSAPGKREASPIDSPPPEKAGDVRHESRKGSSFAGAARPTEKPSRGILLKVARGGLHNTPELERPKKQTARFAAGINSRPLKKPKLEAAASPVPIPPPLEGNMPEPANLVQTRPANARSDESADKASATTLAKQPVTAAQMTGEVSVLTDPYPSLRADQRGSKKQNQGASLELGHLRSQVVPVYPEEAKRQGIQGTVKLHAVVDRYGSVTSMQPVSGPSILGAAVVKAMRQWVYTETKLAGQPVETEVDVAVVFRLSSVAPPKS